MCRRFDTIPACDRWTDGQTDGIAVASTARAMPALRRAVKSKQYWAKKLAGKNVFDMTYFMSSHGRKTLTQSVIRHADIESKRLNLLLSSQHRMAAYDLFSYTPPRLHDTSGCPTGQLVASCIQTFNRLNNRLCNRHCATDNRLNNRLHRVNKHPTGCQTGCATGWMFLPHNVY